MPLTLDRAKPAVPFGGHYRLIDFVLSNLANGGFTKIVVLTQYKSHSLDCTSPGRGGCRPSSATTCHRSRPRCDGARMVHGLGGRHLPEPQHHRRRVPGLHLRLRRRPRLPHGPAPDARPAHRDRGRSHRRRHPGAQRDASQFGVIEHRRRHAHPVLPGEAGRPARPGRRPRPGLRVHGQLHVHAPTCCSRPCTPTPPTPSSRHDMGGDLDPHAGRPAARRTSTTSPTTDVPGATERDRGYWRDVGTLDSYYDANMDLVSVHPVFNLYNRQWPIYTGRIPAAAGQVRLRGRTTGRARRSTPWSAPGRSSRGHGPPLGDLPRGADRERRRRRGLGHHERRRRRPGAVVRRAIIDKNVGYPARRPDRRRPRPRPAALHGVRKGIVVIGKGADHRRAMTARPGTRGSLCSPGSSRPRSTAAPASTSSTSARELARLVDVGGLLLRGAPARRTSSPPPTSPVGRDPGRRRRRRPGRHVGRPADGGRRRAASTWSTATPGTPTSAGHLAKLLYDIPHVVTTHSLEPLRPWKREQLGAGYAAVLVLRADRASTHADAVIAVSRAMRDDVLRAYPAVDPSRVHVIHNGIDPDEYRPDPGTDVARPLRHRPGPALVIFVGRITRQKGIVHLLDAARLLDPAAQLVLCAGAPGHARDRGRDPEPGQPTCRPHRRGVFWIEEMLPRGRDRPAAQPRHRLRLPVGLRAVRADQPGGHGLRAAGGGHRHRRDPRDRRRRRDGLPGPVRAGR